MKKVLMLSLLLLGSACSTGNIYLYRSGKFVGYHSKNDSFVWSNPDGGGMSESIRHFVIANINGHTDTIPVKFKLTLNPGDQVYFYKHKNEIIAADSADLKKVKKQLANVRLINVLAVVGIIVFSLILPRVVLADENQMI
jgi:hypothetical protein